jgi:ABC-type Zn uptake system ZnuABC Zn-binding protein ZnuA
MSNFRKLSLLVAGLLGLMLLLAACGDTPTSTTAPVSTTASAVTTVATTAAVTPSAPTTAASATTAVATTVAPTTAVATTSAPTTVASTTAVATTAAPPTTADASVKKVKAVATTTQIGDFVKNVGGERVELYTIMKPGGDAHTFEPTAEDAKALGAAQIIFYNGVELEAWYDKTAKASGTKATQVNMSDGAILLAFAHEHEPGGTHDHAHGEYDPHIWFSTENAKTMVNNIAVNLGRLDAEGKATYEANAKKYTEQLDALTSEIKTMVATIPQDRRKLVTNHEAFGYFADQFKLKVVGAVIPSFDTNAEPSAQQIAELVKKIRDQKVPAIFAENSLNPKLAEQIGKEANIKVYTNLYSDSLGAPGTDGDTYLKMMLANAKTIVNGLK